MLDRLKLTTIRDQIDVLLDEAARSEMTLREALAFFTQREIARRDKRRIAMARKIAQFPFVRELAGFALDQLRHDLVDLMEGTRETSRLHRTVAR